VKTIVSTATAFTFPAAGPAFAVVAYSGLLAGGGASVLESLGNRDHKAVLQVAYGLLDLAERQLNSADEVADNIRAGSTVAFSSIY